MAKALNTQPQRSGSSVSSGGRGNNNNWIIQILFVAFILSFISFNSFYGPATLQQYNPAGLSSSYGAIGSPVAYQQQQPSSPYGLHVNEYPAVALPSIRTSEEEETKIERKFMVVQVIKHILADSQHLIPTVLARRYGNIWLVTWVSKVC